MMIQRCFMIKPPKRGNILSQQRVKPILIGVIKSFDNPYGVGLRFSILYTYTLKGASITLPLGNKGGI